MTPEPAASANFATSARKKPTSELPFGEVTKVPWQEYTLIQVDTEKSDPLVNDRFAYVSVSRAQHEAHRVMPLRAGTEGTHIVQQGAGPKRSLASVLQNSAVDQTSFRR